MLRINTKIDEVNFEKWAEFVKKHPNGNIFQTPQMVELYKRTKKHTPVVILAEEEENVVGVIVGVIQKEISGFLGYFTARCIVLGGPLVKANDSVILQNLLKIFNKEVRRKVIYTQFRNFFEIGNIKQCIEKAGYQYEPHLDIHISLKQNPDEYWNTLKSKLRQNIRKAEKKGVQFKFIESKAEIVDGYNILKTVYKDAGLPLPDISFFYNAFDIFGENKNIALFKATYKNKIIGVRFALLFNNVVFDWYAGSKKEYYSFYPNDFLIFKVLEWGMKNDRFHVFDFGGAGKPNVPYGVRDHKLKFSDNLVEFGRFQKTHNPLLFFLAKQGLKLLQKIKP